MKLCEPHREGLRAAIAARGLEAFISPDGVEAIRRIREAQKHAKPTAGTFDPLIGASADIAYHAMEAMGPRVFEPLDDGADRCPLCMLAEVWIDHAVEAQVMWAARLGLLGKPAQ